MSFRTRRRVEFRDTDAAGIAHFSVFFPWMESAEHEMLRSVGVEVLPEPSADGVTWPRVSTSCDYKAAARFEDLLDIEASIGKIGRSSVHYEFRFARDADSGQKVEIAVGRIVVVCCRLLGGGGLEKVDIPGTIRQKLASL